MVNLTPKKRKAVLALIEHGSADKAAEAAGVTRQTVYKWQEEPAFIAALQEAEHATLVSFQRELVGMGHLAASALRDGLQDDDIRVRLRAADIFTGRLLQLRDLLDIEARLAALERLNSKR